VTMILFMMKVGDFVNDW